MKTIVIIIITIIILPVLIIFDTIPILLGGQGLRNYLTLQVGMKEEWVVFFLYVILGLASYSPILFFLT